MRIFCFRGCSCIYFTAFHTKETRLGLEGKGCS
uniref:Uncharacterized protein n=1 Tax=Anopheles quadriannulatus TaxID=34691 RepID=A0A182XQV1_ANOQN